MTIMPVIQAAFLLVFITLLIYVFIETARSAARADRAYRNALSELHREIYDTPPIYLRRPLPTNETPVQENKLRKYLDF